MGIGGHVSCSLAAEGGRARHREWACQPQSPARGRTGLHGTQDDSRRCPLGGHVSCCLSFFDVTEPLHSCSPCFLFKPPIIIIGVTRKQAPSPRPRVSPSEHLLSSQPKLRSWTRLQTHPPRRLTSTDCFMQAPSPSGLPGFDHSSTRRNPKGRRRERLGSSFSGPLSVGPRVVSETSTQCCSFHGPACPLEPRLLAECSHCSRELLSPPTLGFHVASPEYLTVPYCCPFNTLLNHVKLLFVRQKWLSH